MKSLFATNCLFSLLLCAAAFAGCKEEGDGRPDGTDPVGPTANTADITYLIDGGSDFLLLFDAAAKYTDAEGETVTEAINTFPWEKTVTDVALPCTAALELVLTPSDDYEEKEQYAVGFGYGIAYETSDGRQAGGTSVNKLTVAKSKIDAYRESVLSRELKTSVPIAAE
ncbi:MAG TPA: hypothetical protein H9866_05630 [Candidatus Tidjanibacter gallistercoris]|nr:hypothetical protein [Candidatus Tidjanibacter gallistercoris]